MWKGDGIARKSPGSSYSYANSQTRTISLNSDGTWNLKVTGKEVYAYDASGSDKAFTIMYNENYYMYEGTYTGKPASDGTIVFTITRQFSDSKQTELWEEATSAKKTKSVSITAQTLPLETLATPIEWERTISGTTLTFDAEYTRQ